MKTIDVEEKIEAIKKLNSDLKKMTTLKAGIIKEVGIQKAPFEIHQVRTDCLSIELDESQKVLKSLKMRLEFESAVCECLKEICLSLKIDEENLHVLQTGSFSQDIDIVKMEKSLLALNGISSGKYTLKIIKEQESQIRAVLSEFLKRFVVFLSQMFIKTSNSSELKVHSEFYKKIEKYKFIYQFSRKISDYYNVLCVAYARKSKDMYSSEFKIHLNRISDLIQDANALRISLDAIILQYSDFLKLEKLQMKRLGIETDPKEVFAGVDAMIGDFIDIFFKKFPHCIVLALNLYTREDNLSELGSLGAILLEKRNIFSEVFLYHQKNHLPTFETADLVELLEKSRANDFLLKGLKNIIVKKALDKRMAFQGAVQTFQILHLLENLENASEIIKQVEDLLVPKIVDFAFDGRDLSIAVNEIMGFVDKTKKGSDDIVSFFKKTLLENCEESQRDPLLHVFSRLKS